MGRSAGPRAAKASGQRKQTPSGPRGRRGTRQKKPSAYRHPSMTLPDLPEIPLASIEVGDDRARELDPAWAEALSVLIAARGQLHPITVRQVGDRYRLVAGLQRLEAVRLLGRNTIPARLSSATSDDEARLEEVMENLGRYDLIALDRCHHLYELKRVWERMQVKTLVEVLAEEGGKTFSTPAERPEVFGFARSIAEKVGLSKQAINMAVKIWAELAPESRRRLTGTALAAKQTELKALSEQPPALQAKILDLILGGDHPLIQNVAAAQAFLERGVAVSPIEKQFKAVNAAFGKLPDAGVDMIVAHHADRVIASLARLGRI